MLKQLFIASSLVSAAFGAEDLMSTSNPIELSTKPCDLNSLHLTLTRSDVAQAEVIRAIAELSKNITLSEYNINDTFNGCIDHFDFKFHLKINPPEIQRFIDEHSDILHSVLFVSQSIFPEPQWGEYQWFIYILMVLNNQTNHIKLTSCISDKSLNQIDEWLAIPQETIHLLTFISFLRLIDHAIEPATIEKMQKISLKYLDDFIKQRNNIPLYLLKLASMKSDYTFEYIYQLHKMILKPLYKELAKPVMDELAIGLRVEMMICLTNYRDVVITKVLERLKFNTLFKMVIQTTSTMSKLQESKLIQQGNPSFQSFQSSFNSDKDLNEAVEKFIHDIE